MTPIYKTHINPRASGRLASAGFSLVELMISITIGLVIIASLVAVLSGTSSSSNTNDRESDLVTSGRYALDSLKQEIRKARFKGYTAVVPSTPNPWTAPGSGCSGAESGASAGAFVSNLHQGIWGADDTNPFSANCIPGDGTTSTSSYAALTDVLVLRRLSDFPLATGAALSANTVYFESSYARGQVFRSTSTPTRPTFPVEQRVPLGTFTVNTYVYYISPFTVSVNENPKVPALWRVALQPDGTMARELVVSGIERMQVQYGLQQKDGTGTIQTQYVNTLAGGSSDNETTAQQWDSVRSVRLWLLARSATAEPGFVNKQTYLMGSQDFTPNDGFRRQLFSTIVELRN